MATSTRNHDDVKGVFERFVHSEVSGSALLLVCTASALSLANSSFAEVYFGLLYTKVGVSWGDAKSALTVQHWINDLLMVVFFFVVGLEIKRELLVGQLSSTRKALLPLMAALGGMVVPALLYAAFNAGGAAAGGWGIPMATDIAFALGVLALFGKRVPIGLKVFLTALAIVDDLGAVLVIAIFYTAQVHWVAVALAFLALIAVANRLRIAQPVAYVALAVGVWAGVLAKLRLKPPRIRPRIAADLRYERAATGWPRLRQIPRPTAETCFIRHDLGFGRCLGSGVHATVAGVLVALLVPIGARRDPQKFLAVSDARLAGLRAAHLTPDSMVSDRSQFDAISDLHQIAGDMRPPGLALEEMLHPFVVFFILPLFALFNAGVAIDSGFVNGLLHPVSLGILAGLVIGKQIGIALFSWVAVKSGQAALPDGVSWSHIYGGACIAGIGFTMSLFVTELAFTDLTLLARAKVGILMASLVAAVWGAVLLQMRLPRAHAGRA
jgi:NhaA family Na+:H+ antiporter